MIKQCHTCKVPLVVDGVHQAIAFSRASVGMGRYAIFCGKCYDERTTKDNIQRTGEESV